MFDPKVKDFSRTFKDFQGLSRQFFAAVVTLVNVRFPGAEGPEIKEFH